MTKFIIRDREAGNEIARFDSYEEAVAELEKYEETDKAEGNYTEDFYEIYGKTFTVCARTTEVKCSLDREEAAELTEKILNDKVDAQIDRLKNGTPDESYDFDSLEEALKKYEELKALNLTFYQVSNRLLYIYQVYVEQVDFHDDEIWDSCETIKFFTDTNIRWGA
jgi:hypothetical protein